MPDGTYPVPPQAGGPQTVIMKAYDKAGNFKESRKDLTLPAVTKTVKGGEPAQTSSANSWIEHALVLLLTLALGAMIALYRSNKNHVSGDRTGILKEVGEIREKNDQIFAAMREEFEQLINEMDPKPQLTPPERDLLESVKEVLDISGGLIDSSLEELKKKIREQR
jgi:hypothetical protein